jgi:hypothetical protein
MCSCGHMSTGLLYFLHDPPSLSTVLRSATSAQVPSRSGYPPDMPQDTTIKSALIIGSGFGIVGAPSVEGLKSERVRECKGGMPSGSGNLALFHPLSLSLLRYPTHA